METLPAWPERVLDQRGSIHSNHAESELPERETSAEEPPSRLWRQCSLHVRTFPNADPEAQNGKEPSQTEGDMRFIAKAHRKRMRQIRRLSQADEEFRLLWEDYLLARRAFRHFTTLGEEAAETAGEYRQYCMQLAEEVRGYLDEQ